MLFQVLTRFHNFIAAKCLSLIKQLTLVKIALNVYFTQVLVKKEGVFRDVTLTSLGGIAVSVQGSAG